MCTICKMSKVEWMMNIQLHKIYDLKNGMRMRVWLISQIVCFESLNLEKQFTWNNK